MHLVADGLNSAASRCRRPCAVYLPRLPRHHVSRAVLMSRRTTTSFPTVVVRGLPESECSPFVVESNPRKSFLFLFDKSSNHHEVIND